MYNLWLVSCSFLLSTLQLHWKFVSPLKTNVINLLLNHILVIVQTEAVCSKQNPYSKVNLVFLWTHNKNRALNGFMTITTPIGHTPCGTTIEHWQSWHTHSVTIHSLNTSLHQALFYNGGHCPCCSGLGLGAPIGRFPLTFKVYHLHLWCVPN